MLFNLILEKSKTCIFGDIDRIILFFFLGSWSRKICKPKMKGKKIEENKIKKMNKRPKPTPCLGCKLLDSSAFSRSGVSLFHAEPPLSHCFCPCTYLCPLLNLNAFSDRKLSKLFSLFPYFLCFFLSNLHFTSNWFKPW